MAVPTTGRDAAKLVVATPRRPAPLVTRARCSAATSALVTVSGQVDVLAARRSEATVGRVAAATRGALGAARPVVVPDDGPRS